MLYTTKDDYINEVIIPALGEYRDLHNTQAIADDMLTWRDHINANKAGYTERDDVDFWDIVENHAL